MTLPVLFDGTKRSPAEIRKRQEDHSVTTQCALLRGAMLDLTEEQVLRDGFDRAVAGVMGAEAGDFDRARHLRDAVSVAAMAVVRAASPRNPWFLLGHEIGNWLGARDAAVLRVLRAAVSGADTPNPTIEDAPRVLRAGYVPPSYQRVLNAACRIGFVAAAHVPPVRALIEVAGAGSDPATVRNALERYVTLITSRIDGADPEEWEADYCGMIGFLGATCEALVTPARGQHPQPHWNRSRGELWFDGARVKTIVVNKARQVVRLLDGFEGQGWPDRIDAPTGSPDSKSAMDDETLREAVKSLNSRLVGLWFGTVGKGAYWKRKDPRG